MCLIIKYSTLIQTLQIFFICTPLKIGVCGSYMLSYDVNVTSIETGCFTAKPPKQHCYQSQLLIELI